MIQGVRFNLPLAVYMYVHACNARKVKQQQQQQPPWLMNDDEWGDKVFIYCIGQDRIN